MFVLPDFVDATVVAELLAANARFAGRRRGEGTPWTDHPLAEIAPVGLAADLAGRVADALHDGHPHLPCLAADYLAYTVMLVGAWHRLHADAVKEDGSPNHTPQRIATAMLYLNGEGAAFDGGVIAFPGCGVTVRPQAGQLVAFLTDWTHRHEVSKVTRGERHALAFWFKRAA